MNIEDLTIKQVRELSAFLQPSPTAKSNPMLGKRVLVRTYSAGVHIGTVVSIDGMECHLIDALRLWKWTGGALSLSSVATTGIQGGRLDKTPEVYLTNCIEFIPVTPEAMATYAKFIEN